WFAAGTDDWVGDGAAAGLDATGVPVASGEGACGGRGAIGGSGRSGGWGGGGGLGGGGGPGGGSGGRGGCGGALGAGVSGRCGERVGCGSVAVAEGAVRVGVGRSAAPPPPPWHALRTSATTISVMAALDLPGLVTPFPRPAACRYAGAPSAPAARASRSMSAE